MQPCPTFFKLEKKERERRKEGERRRVGRSVTGKKGRGGDRKAKASPGPLFPWITVSPGWRVSASGSLKEQARWFQFLLCGHQGAWCRATDVTPPDQDQERDLHGQLSDLREGASSSHRRCQGFTCCEEGTVRTPSPHLERKPRLSPLCASEHVTPAS